MDITKHFALTLISQAVLLGALAGNASYAAQAVSASQEQSAYKGSQANNDVLKSLSETVNPATDSLSLSLPLIKAKGYLPLNITLTYSSGTQGLFGLPTGWQYNLDSVVPGKSATVDGQTYVIDPNWKDMDGNATGLKYLNEQGVSFKKVSSNPAVPYDDGRHYQYLFTNNDGSHDYFDSTGKLLMQDDRFGNHITYHYRYDSRGPLNNPLVSVTDSLGTVYHFSLSSGMLEVSYTDSLGKTYSKSVTITSAGVQAYKDELGMTTAFGYITLDGMHLINEITYPNGLQTMIKYGNKIKFKDAQGQQKYFLGVSEIQHIDLASHKVLDTKEYEYGTRDPGNNFTGYPRYALGTDKDNLLESNSDSYQYDVMIIKTDGTHSRRSGMVFNSMGVPIETDQYLSGDSNNQPTIKSVNHYQLVKNQHARTVNYDSPYETDEYALNPTTHQYTILQKATMTYDNAGNTTDQKTYQYDPLAKKLQLTSETSAHFDPTYNLQKDQTQIVYNPVTGKQQVTVTTNQLTDDNKEIGSSQVNYGDSQSQSPWKTMSYGYDNHGVKKQTTLQWVSHGHDGVQSSLTKQSYVVDPSKHTVTITKTNALGDSTTKVVDVVTGNTLKTISSPDGKQQDVTSYTYDADGRVLTTTNPLGHVTHTTYYDYAKDGVNAVVQQSQMDFKQKTVQDAMGRTVADYATTDPQDKSKWVQMDSKTYNGFGEVASQTDGFGNVSTMQYDTLGFPVEQIGPDGNDTKTTYNFAALTAAQTVNSIPTAAVTYNVSKKPLLSIQYANSANPHNPGYGLAKQVIYDGAGQEIKVIDSQVNANGQRQTINSLTKTYDADNNLTSETMVNGQDQEAVTFNYDLLGKMLNATKVLSVDGQADAPVKRDVFSYDQAGQLLTDTNQLDGVIKYTYDQEGHKLTETRLNGQVITYTYRADGLVNNKSWQDYDGTKHLLEYAYDGDGHVLSLTEVVNNKKSVMSFTYNLAGKLTSTTYPDGKVSYDTYNGQEQLASTTDVNGLTTTYTYQPDGKLQQATNGDHKVVYTYHTKSNPDIDKQYGTLDTKTVDNVYTETDIPDGLGRMVQMIKTSPDGKTKILNVYRTFNNQNQVTNETMVSDLNPSDQNINYSKDYTYDGFNQLTEEKKDSLGKQPISDIAYHYDSNGNILTKVDNGKTTTYHYNPLDQLISYTEGDTTYKPTFNTNGDETSDGKGTTYAYNGLSQLVKATLPSSNQVVTYGYYPNGARATRDLTDITNTKKK